MKHRYIGIMALLWLGVSSAFSNPVDLSAPMNSLGASNAYGYLQVYYDVEDIDWGDGLKIPLRYKFSSELRQPSPYLGQGFWMPMLESTCYLKRESMMRATLPCGKTMFLRRDRNQPNQFKTLNGEWTGIMQENQVAISREDGWQLKYTDGRLSELRTDNGRILKWIYRNNLLAEIREAGTSGKAPLQVMSTPSGGIKGFIINGEEHLIQWDKKPRIEEIQGNRLIADLEESMSLWTYPDGKKEQFIHEVVQETLTPYFKRTDPYGKESVYTWNPATGHILTDAEGWKYQIGGTKKQFDIPDVSRTNAEGQEEFVKVDNKVGTREKKTLDEGHVIRYAYRSTGVLHGKLRRVEQIKDGIKRTTRQLGYDELGRLIRETDHLGFTRHFQFGEDGELVKKTLSPTRDKKVLAELAEREELLKVKITKAVFAGDRDSAIQDLGFHYIHEMKQPDRALALIDTMEPDSKYIFSLKLHAINYDENTTYQDQIQRFTKLLEEYPGKKSTLQFLIDDLNYKLSKKTHENT